MAIPFEVGKTYNFTTLVGSQIGSIFKNMKVEAIMSLTEATRYRDVIGLHRSLYPSLPPGTPYEPNDLTYIGFRPQDEEVAAGLVVLALQWINQDSIVEVTGLTFTITVYNATNADINLAAENLRSIGIRSFEITTQDQ